jgi:surface protein
MLLSNGWTMTSGLTFTSSATPPSGGNLVMTFNTALAASRPPPNDTPTVYLPLGSDLGNTVNATIYWGDGSNTLATSANVYSHTYAANGNYQVTVTGIVSAYGQLFYDSENVSLISVDSWDDDLGLDSLRYAFNGATNLQTVPDYLPITVQSLTATFRLANTSNLDIGNWDISNVTSLGSFVSDTAFNGNIGGWNTGNVQYMSGAFAGATQFNQDISGWDTSNVQYMDTMFYGASSFNQDISSWNTSTLFTINGMFAFANAFNQNIGGWDTSSVNDMAGAFSYANSFNGNIGDWTTNNVTQMNIMFQNAANFNQDISSWNVGNVANMYSMFENANVFDQDISSWNVGNVGNVDQMFQNAASFNQNLSSWTTNVASQPSNFSLGANAVFANNASNLKPYLSGGTVRINT